GGGGGFGGFTGGTRVDPGEYTVKVAVGKNEQTKKVVVEEDPRITISASDRGARRQALNQLSQMATTGVAARRSITGLRTSLNTAIENWKKPGAAKPPDNVQKSAEDLLKRVDETCRKLATPAQCGDRSQSLGSAGPPLVYVPPAVTQRVTQLLGGIENYAGAPTQWQLDQIKVLQPMLTEANAAARKLASEDLAALNKMMSEAGVPYIAAPGRASAVVPPAGEEEP
ncbi:MAG: hypothetical protein M3041_10015, partial [Acidobacteriota bacterium]|nr:hypothetical protein [Acidobacteriota bacterium]